MHSIKIPHYDSYFKFDNSFVEVITSMASMKSKTPQKGTKGFNLMLAVLNEFQRQYNESIQTTGQAPTKYEGELDDLEFTKFIQYNYLGNKDITKYSKRRIKMTKLAAIGDFAISSSIKYDKSPRCEVFTNFVDVCVHFTGEDKEEIGKCDFIANDIGVKWLNDMFGSTQQNKSHSIYMVALGCCLSTFTGKCLLAFICRYYNAIIQGKWGDGGRVVFKLDTLWDVCGFSTNQITRNKSSIESALKEINEGLTIMGATDRNGYPINIQVNYLLNGDYGYDNTKRTTAITHIQFKPVRIGTTPINKGHNNIRDLF